MSDSTVKNDATKNPVKGQNVAESAEIEEVKIEPLSDDAIETVIGGCSFQMCSPTPPYCKA